MLNLGFIGTGWIVGAHLRALARCPDARVAAFCNPHVEKAQALAKERGAKAYADYRAMLDQEKLDAVYVCLPPFAHQGQEEELVRRGIPFLVEKPLGLDMARQEAVGKMVAEKGLVTSVGYSFKYKELADQGAEMLRGHTPILVRGCWFSAMPGVYWWRKRDTCGGQIIEQSTHVFDILRALFGEVEAVQGFANQGAMRGTSDYDVEDSSSINLRFRNGVVGNVCSAIYAPPQGEQFVVEVVCMDATLRLSFFDDRLSFRGPDGLRECECGGGEENFYRESRAFLDAVAGGEAAQIRSSYADALKTQRLTFAAMAALRDGQTVRL